MRFSRAQVGIGMLTALFAMLTVCGSAGQVDTGASAATHVPTVLLVMGAPGDAQYASNFVQQVEAWKETVGRAAADCMIIGDTETNELSDRELLRQQLASLPHESLQPLWLVLIGHGTFDGATARFNMRGPDISSQELAEWLKPFSRPLVVINTASASAPFINALSRTNCVIVTATRNGGEQNFARFGGQLAQAIGDLGSDLDQDEQVSLLEAFIAASGQVEEYYKTEGQLVTEHALIDDNGDGKGTPADWFRGVHPTKSAKGVASVDGVRAHQLHLVLSPAEQSLSPETREKRNVMELKIAELRKQKSEMDEAAYYAQLEKLLLQLAHLYQTNEPPAAQQSTN